MHHLFLLLTLVGLSLFLFLPWPLALAACVPLVILSFVGYSIGSQAGHRPVVTGKKAMLGDEAVVLAVSDGKTEVAYQGEIWRAVSSWELHQGDRVIILEVDGLTLTVAPSLQRQL